MIAFQAFNVLDEHCPTWVPLENNITDDIIGLRVWRSCSCSCSSSSCSSFWVVEEGQGIYPFQVERSRGEQEEGRKRNQCSDSYQVGGIGWGRTGNIGDLKKK